MTSVFINSNVYDNSKMKSMKGKGIAQSVTGSQQISSSKNLAILMDRSFGLNNSSNGIEKVTSFDVINMFCMTNCLACRYPKNDRLNHHMQRCNILKEYGLTVTYDTSTNKHRDDTKKHHIDKAKKPAKRQQERKDADRATPSTETGSTSILNISAQAGGEAINPFKTVCQLE